MLEVADMRERMALVIGRYFLDRESTVREIFGEPPITGTPTTPYELAEGDWETRREEFGDAVIDTLSEYIPNLKDILLHRQVLTPLDIERITGLSEGNIFQGELDLSQLFFLRPAAGYANYRTPIRGYYQCGSGTHPGGGITGAPGRLAALEILKDLGL